MNSRRDLLKTGIGLAGIIASGHAPATIVKSLVGANGITYIDYKKGLPTAKSYIQDGLVVLQDAIENVDWGVHDPNPDIWFNLVNHNVLGYDLTKDKSNTYQLYFTDNAICRDGQYGGGVDNSLYYKPFLVWPTYAEVVGLISTWLDGNYISWANSYGFTLTRSRCLKICCNLTNGPGLNVPVNERFTAGIFSAVRDSTDMNDYYFSMNGNEVDGTMASAYTGTAYKVLCRCSGEINCLRIYNRQLTPEEIAHNYEVDRIRFNFNLDA